MAVGATPFCSNFKNKNRQFPIKKNECYLYLQDKFRKPNERNKS